MSKRHRFVALAVALLVGFLAATVSVGADPAWSKPHHGDRIKRLIKRMTLEEKVGQMFVTYGYGRTVDDPDPAMVALNQADFGVDSIAQLIDRYHLGGVIYYAWTNNVLDPPQIAHLSNGIQAEALAQRSPIPMLVSTDQEQGVIVRVAEPATQFPGSMALGAARDPELACASASITAQELRAVGINQNYAPVADVNVNALNPVIGVRSFSSDPELASELTEEQVECYQDEDLIATVKHFPGHGDTHQDSHLVLPVIDHTIEELEAIDFPPFEAAIDADVDAVMTAHLEVPALDDSGRPATLSRPILTGVLRDDMDFDGVIVTDALNMDALQQFDPARIPIETIKAGADILLRPPDLDLAYNAVLGAVGSGELKERRIDQSVRRILELKEKRGLFDDPFVDEGAVSDVVGTPEHLATADTVTDSTVTLVENADATLPLSANSGANVLVTGWGVTTTTALASSIAARGLSTEAFETGVNPDAARRQAAVAAAQGRDLVVVTSMNAWTVPNAGQRDLVRELVATGVPVVVIAVRDPYDIAYFTEASTYLATYSFRAVSMAATTRVLFGEVDPTGILPVDIPTSADPDEILYPYGHGLSYG